MTQGEREVYLDHAATTYLDPRVSTAMAPYWEGSFGNPSSVYRQGRKAKLAVAEARRGIAQRLHCQADELIFVGSGTESDNLALFGVCNALKARELSQLSSSDKTPLGAPKRHIITSQIEHKAVLEPCRRLEREGYAVTYLPVDSQGRIDPQAVKAAIRPETLLVSIMYANNEFGTVQPIAEIAAICREAGVLCHTDACQAAGALSLDVQKLGVDLLSLNGSKIYGPKGIGLLYVKQGTPIAPIIYGGGQELGLRSGTENVPAIVGLAKALELVVADQGNENRRIQELRQWFWRELQERVPGIRLNGHPTERLPNNLNVLIPGLDSEAFLLLMDEHGIACAAGSACDTASDQPSHALLALGLSEVEAKASVRFTLGRRTSKADLEYVVSVMTTVLSKLAL